MNRWGADGCRLMNERETCGDTGQVERTCLWSGKGDQILTTPFTAPHTTRRVPDTPDCRTEKPTNRLTETYLDLILKDLRLWRQTKPTYRNTWIRTRTVCPSCSPLRAVYSLIYLLTGMFLRYHIRTSSNQLIVVNRLLITNGLSDWKTGNHYCRVLCGPSQAEIKVLI